MKPLNESFEEFKLNEIGEGVKPYRYQGPNKKQILSKLNYEYERNEEKSRWSDDAKLTWTFKGDKGYYTAEITFSVKALINLNPFLRKKKNPNLKPTKKRQITGNIGFFETRGKDKERTTDFGEQFSVLSTVSEIVIEFFNSIMDEYKIDTFYMIPKADKGETESVDNRRGKFYEAYIKKQIKRVKEPISVEVVDKIRTDDGGTVGGFILRGGHWSGGSQEFIKNESELFSPGDKDSVKGTGYGSKEKAEATVKIMDDLKKKDHKHAMAIATTMYNRAKHSKNQSQGMRDAIPIFKKWIEDNKKS